MTYQFIQVDKKNGVATLTLQRSEKCNALNGQMVTEITQALAAIKAEPEIRVLILASAGKHFCAGADLDWMRKMAQATSAENAQDARALSQLLYELHTLDKVTIALVKGATVGGGLGLAAACDMILAAPDAQFCFSEVQWGLVPFIVSPYVIPALGERMARYYFLTAEKFNAEKACASGLVTQVIKDADLLLSGEQLAQHLLKQGPLALSRIKQLVREMRDKNPSPVLAEETARHLAEWRSTAEAREGIRSFLEKRPPAWQAKKG